MNKKYELGTWTFLRIVDTVERVLPENVWLLHEGVSTDSYILGYLDGIHRACEEIRRALPPDNTEQQSTGSGAAQKGGDPDSEEC